MRIPCTLHVRVVTLLLLVLIAAPAAFAQPGNSYVRVDLVTDQGGAQVRHPVSDLVNAWGLAASPTGPWWVNAADTGKSLLFNGHGSQSSLVVSVPGNPTGIVFNGGSAFVVPGAGPARFLFASEDGTISGWSPSHVPNTDAVVVVDSSDADASYKGLAIDSTTAGTRIYAADFHNARVDVFDGTFNPVHVAGAFTDPNLPAGFAPFGIQMLAGSIFVAYAKQDEDAADEVAGPGLGFVDKYDLSGHLMARVATRGALNAPWGMAMAPQNFGRFGGKLLIGNFGNGRINVYDPVTFRPRGFLKGDDGKAIAIDGLWGIAFGNGGLGGPANTLFFAAGPDEESHGLFGRIDPQ